MAELERAQEVFVGLGLEEADTGVELVEHWNFLVVLGKEADKGGVVGTDGGDVGVLADTELRVAVAGCLCRDWDSVERAEQ